MTIQDGIPLHLMRYETVAVFSAIRTLFYEPGTFVRAQRNTYSILF